MSMYKGKETFTENQLIFIVESIISSALDQIEYGLPSSGVRPSERKSIMGLSDPTKLSSMDHSALETCGMTIAIIYAQLTMDGISCSDILSYKITGYKHTILSMATDFVKSSVLSNKKPKEGDSVTPDCHNLSKSLVKELFKYYLKTNGTNSNKKQKEMEIK